MAWVDEVLTDSAQLAYLFEQTAGATAEDLTANNRDGTYVGAYTLTVTGIDLDGNSGRVTTGYDLYSVGASLCVEGESARDTSTGEQTLVSGDGSGAPWAGVRAGTRNVEWWATAAQPSPSAQWVDAWPNDTAAHHWVINHTDATAHRVWFGRGVTGPRHD